MKRFRFSVLSGLALVLALADGGAAQIPAPHDPTIAQAPYPAPGRIGPGAPPEAVPRYSPAPRPVPQPQPRVEVVVEPGVHISPITPLAETVNVHAKVLEQCRLQTMLALLIAERHPEVVVSDADGQYRLELTIIDIRAPSGGIFSGRKSVTAEGVLFQGRSVIGSFVAKRSSLSSTTCGMIANVIIVMAGDIAQFLYNPSHDARLGEAR